MSLIQNVHVHPVIFILMMYFDTKMSEINVKNTYQGVIFR